MPLRTACAPAAVPTEIERTRLAKWLGATASAAIRAISAPVGAGKTVAVKQYAARSAGRVKYVRVPQGASELFLHESLAAHTGSGEVIVDGIERIEAGAYGRFIEQIAAGEVPTKLILVGRSRRRLHAHALLVRGLARAYDPAALAFDAGEIAALADAFGTAHDDDDIAQLLHDTEGWPLAAQWLIRDAAENGRSLHDAFNHWRERNGHLLLEFIENESCEDADAFAIFRSLLTDVHDKEPPELDRFEQAGLPLVRTRNGVRPYRILRRLASPNGIAADRLSRMMPPIMILSVLGKFRCEIAGQAVAFARRRDQNVLVFVALAPEGRATREAVLDAFWPGIDRRSAAQGLRTTLSRIRRAIADAAPGYDAEGYFSTTSELRVDRRAVAVDVRRFIDHIEQGRLDDALGATDGAKYHYRCAYRIYHDRLLASEALEHCFDAIASSLHRLYCEALNRLTQLYAALGELETAREYARKLIACNTDDARNSALSFLVTAPTAPG